jgi:hypothetical protein
MVARTIQLIIAPVVMVTTCSIMLGGLLGHYAAINDRLRGMSRERLDLLRKGMDMTDAITAERFQEIDTQVPELIHRHKLVRNAVLAVYCAILVFVVDMFVIAISTVTDIAWITGAVLIVFLAGTATLLLGVLMMAVEIRSSHRTVEFEAQRVLALGK